MQIVRKKLSADEVTPRGTRYNVDCDCVQVTSDGGTTWVDAPGFDPRTSDVWRVPALTTADPRCDAAANMIAFLTGVIDADIAAANIIAEATGFIGLVSLFFPIVLLADLVLAVAGLIAGIGSIALSGAFTSDVYDQLLCTFQDRLETDGTMTDADLTGLLGDIGANYDSVVFDAISAHSSTLGAVGWSNAGASGHETGDCSACDEWCYTFDFTIDEQGFTNLGGQAVYVPGVGWDTVNYTGGPSYRYLAVGRTVAMTLTQASAEFSYSAGTLDPTGDNTFLLSNENFAAPNLIVVPIPSGPTSPEAWMGSQTLSGIAVLILCGAQVGASHDPGGSATLTRLTLHGTGSNPFGVNNC